MADLPGSGLMKRVPADEFARHAAEYLEGTEPVSVEKDGEVIGRYVPTPNGHAATHADTTSGTSGEALLRELEKGIDPESLAITRRLDRIFQGISERTGLTEEELADLYRSEKLLRRDTDS